MAATSYPLAQLSSLTALANIKWHTVGVRVNGQFIPITGSTSAGVADTVHKYCEAWDIVDIVGRGSVNIAGSCGKAQLGTATLGTHKIKKGVWSLGASWQLFDVTGADNGVADTEKNWTYGLRKLRGSVRGWVIADGPVLRTRSETVALDFDQAGNSAGTAIIWNENANLPLVTGGPLPVSIGYEYTSYTWTDDGGGTLRYPMLATTDPGAIKDDVTIDFDTGQNAPTYSTLLYQFQLSNNFTRGGSIDVSAAWRIDQAEASE